jgi:hypothetical protein
MNLRIANGGHLKIVANGGHLKIVALELSDQLKHLKKAA